MVVCYIGLGSNIGDRQQYINAALRKMKLLTRTKVRRMSSVIESEPQGGPAQGLYLNAVVEIETDLGPYQLLAELQNIEAALGRVRTVVNGPRTIDLDILTYGDVCIREEGLCVPHPRMLERKFVLLPLQEIAPGVAAHVRKMMGLRKTVKRKTGKKKGRIKKPAVKAKRTR